MSDKKYIIAVPDGSVSREYVTLNGIVGTLTDEDGDGNYEMLRLIFPSIYETVDRKVIEILLASIGFHFAAYANCHIQVNESELDDGANRLALMTQAADPQNKANSHIVMLSKYMSKQQLKQLPVDDGSYNKKTGRGTPNTQAVGGEQRNGQEVPGELFIPTNDVPLVLGGKCEKLIGDVVDTIVHQQTIFNEYDLASVIDHRSLCFLFHGPSGVGKTQAAKFISKKLDRKLLVVDHAQLLDKYVGETEKRIKEVFEFAKKNECIVFFDEADSLIGTRQGAMHSWEVSKVNTLLQYMETFDGVAFFSTNFADNLDEAVNRRLIMKVEFDLPTPKVRSSIWKALIPAKAPQDPIDFDKLGNEYELTGGEIKNSVIMATVHAAKNNVNLSNEVLEQAAKDTVKQRLVDLFKEQAKKERGKNFGFQLAMKEKE